jgi:DNA-directed RNA polymerase subunit L
MSDPIRNAIARVTAREAAPTTLPPDASELVHLRRRLDEKCDAYDALERSARETRNEMRETIDRLTAELTASQSRCDDAERRCAEMQGRISGMESAPKPAAPDNTKYEALVAEHTDLRVTHGACAAKEAGLNQVIAELRRANETMQAQIQACMVEEPEEPEEEEDSESGCEIEVVRGSDDRIRSMRVRYT